MKNRYKKTTLTMADGHFSCKVVTMCSICSELSRAKLLPNSVFFSSEGILRIKNYLKQNLQFSGTRSYVKLRKLRLLSNAFHFSSNNVEKCSPAARTSVPSGL